MCEEWDQFDRKLKEVKNFINKSHQTLESSPNKKQSLREQHLNFEETRGKIAGQRSKIDTSLDKLKVMSEITMQIYLKP